VVAPLHDASVTGLDTGLLYERADRELSSSIQSLKLATGEPWSTVLRHRPDGRKIASPDAAAAIKRALIACLQMKPNPPKPR
jgi:hypothetical protein